MTPTDALTKIEAELAAWNVGREETRVVELLTYLAALVEVAKAAKAAQDIREAYKFVPQSDAVAEPVPDSIKRHDALRAALDALTKAVEGA